MSNIIARPRYLCAALFLVLSALLAPLAVAASLTLYVSPQGSAQASGEKPDQAFNSLQKALRAAYDKARDGGVDHVRIEVAPGTYKGQRIVLRQLPVAAHFEVVAQSGSKSRPVFDGNGKGGTWFILHAPVQNGARFTFSGLEVTNYITAMSFNGGRKDLDKYLGNNVVENMVFKNIGQVAKADSKPSTAAVRLVNTRGNTIRDNRFIGIRNEQNCELLHSIYLAHHSSGNKITGNTFENVCGSPIRMRDNSNDNIASGNTFRNVQARAVFDEWYCSDKRNAACREKPAPECPSWGNRYEANKVEDSDQRASKTPTFVHIPEVSARCNAGAAPAVGSAAPAAATFRATTDAKANTGSGAKRERMIVQ